MSCFGRILTAIAGLLFLFLCMLTVLSSSSGSLMLEGTPPPTPQDEAAELERSLEDLEIVGTFGQVATVLAVLPLVFLAGFSESVGHSVMLFANRVRPNRFAATLLINAVFFVGGYFLWVAAVSLVAFGLFERQTGVIRVMIAVALSYTVLLYSFLIAIPYLGVLISNVLYFIVFVTMVHWLQVFFTWTFIEALICAATGFVLVLLFRLTVGRPIAWLSGRLVNAIAGTKVQRGVHDAVIYARSRYKEAHHD